jgi:hypothetical protein
VGLQQFNLVIDPKNQSVCHSFAFLSSFANKDNQKKRNSKKKRLKTCAQPIA